MTTVLKFMYLAACLFLFLYLICLGAVCVTEFPTLTQSGISPPLYTAALSASITISICVLMGIGVGLFCLYRRIFKERKGE